MKRKKTKYTINTAKTRLKEASLVSTNDKYTENRIAFMDKFTLCDLTCKAVLESYNKAAGKNKPNTYTNLDMRVIPAAMEYFNVGVPKHILSNVFGGSGNYKKRNTKSAKKLRDGIVHAMNEQDISELIKRHDELKDSMNSFLAYFEE